MNSPQSCYLELVSNASGKNKKQKKTSSVIYEWAVEEEIFWPCWADNKGPRTDIHNV